MIAAVVREVVDAVDSRIMNLFVFAMTGLISKLAMMVILKEISLLTVSSFFKFFLCFF
jgi:hypothetical protein